MAIKPIKVSQLNNYIGRILSTDPILGDVSVVGEISNLKFHNSGHVYFTLKDEKSKINCFLSSANLAKLRYELDEGMEIIIAGYLSVYEPGGYYSLNVRDIEISGHGDLAIAFEKLKNKLHKEGLFDEKYKKTLPVYPKKIAVLTAETGAAIRDILKIIKSKNDMTDVLIYPVLVQGPKAAKEIAEGIKFINDNFNDLDTIIVGRGGGSTEDLWAFNEEIVARAIFNSKIPIISAVGHEIDITISDYVADYRAETPTAAADVAVPDTQELRNYIDDTKKTLLYFLERIYQDKKNIFEKFNISTYRHLMDNRLSYSALNQKQQLISINKSMDNIIFKKISNIEILKAKIDGLSPENIMKKGYAAVTDVDGNYIYDMTRLSKSDSIYITGNTGKVMATVEKVYKNE